MACEAPAKYERGIQKNGEFPAKTGSRLRAITVPVCC
jgi:hypothetical protein